MNRLFGETGYPVFNRIIMKYQSQADLIVSIYWISVPAGGKGGVSRSFGMDCDIQISVFEVSFAILFSNI